jgi:hypothetical protein
MNCKSCGDDTPNLDLDDDPDEELEHDGEDYSTCSCEYCCCENLTEFGAVCSDCILGAHQG